jgi:anaerobic ribonucleoside-triphosphate reductase
MQTASSTLDEQGIATLADSERQPCEVWTRVMGYFRPLSSFNRGKQGEYHERKCFLESKCN